MLVVNLFAPPGAGKSTGAAYIFSKLKMAGINAELVTEFAKDKVWEGNDEVFKNQAYIFGKQSFKMSRCRDKVDVIITNSPLLLLSLYNEDEVLGEDFDKVVKNVFDSYTNLNFFIKRVKPYNPVGRRHSEEESNALTQPIIDLLNKNDIVYEEINGDIQGYDEIVNHVIEYLSRSSLDEFAKQMDEFTKQMRESIKQWHENVANNISAMQPHPHPLPISLATDKYNV